MVQIKFGSQSSNTDFLSSFFPFFKKMAGIFKFFFFKQLDKYAKICTYIDV